jgi:hypothetical protein
MYVLYIRTYMFTYIIYTYIHTYIRIYIHTYIHTYIYICTTCRGDSRDVQMESTFACARALSLFDADTGVIAGPTYTYVTLHICIYVCIYIQIWVCVCVCVCVYEGFGSTSCRPCDLAPFDIYTL